MRSLSVTPKPHITSVNISDIERRRRILYVLLAGTALAATAILLILLFLMRATPNRSEQDLASLYWATAAVFVFTVGIYALARWLSVDAASTVFLVLMTIGAAIADDPIEVAHGRSLITFAIPILAASVLLRPWASFLFAGLSCVVLMVIGRQTGLLPNLLALVVFFLLALISWIFAHNLRRSNEELADSNAQIQQQYSILQGIIESSDASIYSVDRDYRYTSFNQAHASSMAQIYGATIAVRHNALQYITNEHDRAIASTQLARALGGASFTEETMSASHSAEPRTFEVAHSPIIDANDAIIGVAVVARDVTATVCGKAPARDE
ncbi:MAG: PAS domain-containing protein [Anaerolineales bacterium]|nr:PAS domain-containing protein [Anaerolineales bacterium]